MAMTYELPSICLRIFTAFVPRQRPDLAIRRFAQLIQEGKELPVFGDGSMGRDYTYVTDVVSAIDRALACNNPFEIFNIGNSRPVRLDYMIDTLESALGKTARRKYLPDVTESHDLGEDCRLASALYLLLSAFCFLTSTFTPPKCGASWLPL
jgi:nucleoside-diphosphate-sugar epimerase